MSGSALNDAPRDLAIRLFGHLHAAKRIAAMSVEARGEKDRIRLVVVDDAHDLVFDCAQICRVPFATVEWNVLRESPATAASDLIARAGAGIKRIAVHRSVIDVIATLEQHLRSIAVMDVEIED